MRARRSALSARLAHYFGGPGAVCVKLSDGIVGDAAAGSDYLKGRRHAPKGALWDQALAHWQTLPSDAGAKFDKEHVLDCSLLAPQITWGTSPEDVIGVDGTIPDNKPDALAYMGLSAGRPIAGGVQ